MRRVLIPVERLDLARTPIWQVRRLLHHPEAEVILLGVVPAGASPASRQALSEGLDALAGEILAAGVRAHSSLVEGDLAERVVDMVHLSKTELVALATPAPPGPGGWALTRAAIHLLFTCPVPLMVLVGETAPRTVRRILVPLDGSPRASSILGLVETFARAHQAEVTLLRIARCRGALPTALPSALVAELEESLEPALARLTAEGVSARLRVESDPSEVEGILRVAQELEADLLAVTTRGETSGGEWPFGSIAEGLVRRARLPLLVLRVPEPRPEPEPASGRPRVVLQAPPPRVAATPAATILVPTDGGALGDVALALLPRLVPSCAAGARLLRVLPEPSSEGVEAHRLEVETAGRHLDALVERLGRTGVPAQPRVVRGDPSSRILAAAREPDVGLVVMTSHARSGVGRWLLGSVAERVLRRADVPVLVVSPAALSGLDPQGPRFARILVADDGSPTAAAALDPVLALARAHASEVTLCGVAPSSQVAHELLERLRPHRERLAAGGVQARVDVIVGADPTTELLRAAAGVDLVAMGTHGRQGLFRAWLGSITEEVLRRIERPLLVVRAP